MVAPSELILLASLAFGVAVLYSSVGHGGASGYLAAMALVGMLPAQMKPTALILNLLVAGTGSFRYIRAGHFKWGSFWPFAVASVPFAFLGGSTGTTDELYKRTLGAVLVVAALALALPRREPTYERAAPILAATIIGAGMGYVSGLIGVGGGIFLSPLLILAGWATVKQTLGISAFFILVNSAAGLAGHLSSVENLPPSAPWLAAAAFAGGLIGSELGARRLTPQWVRYLLCAVLLIAAGKLLLA